MTAGTEAAEPVVRLATAEDAPGMVRALEAAFGHWPPIDLDVSPVEHLRWKLSRPGPEQAHAVVEVDGEIVAASVRWGSLLKVGAGELMQDGGVDQSVDPRMQGRGLGGRMAAFSHEEGSRTGDVSISSGNIDTRITTIFDKFDPVLVGYPLNVWVQPFGLRAFLGAHLRGGGPVHFARTLRRVIERRRHAATAPPSGPGADAQIEVLSTFDDRVDALWSAFASQFDVLVIRDATYLNWRYADPRAGRSLILGAFEGDRLLGFAVFKRQGREGNVLDLVTDPARPGLAAALLREGAGRMRAAGARGMTCWLPPGHPAEPALRAAGYLVAGISARTQVGPLRRGGMSPGVDLLYSGHARWHWMLGDQDYA